MIMTKNTSDNFAILFCLITAILTEQLNCLLVKFQWLVHISQLNKEIIYLIQINFNVWKQRQNSETFFTFVEIGTK